MPQLINVDIDTVAEPDVVFALHDHPLHLIDLQRKKDAIELFGLSKAFSCFACHQVRHRFVRYCSSCDVRCCQQCFNDAHQQQMALIQQTVASQISVIEEKQRQFTATSTTSHLVGMSLPPVMAACLAGDFPAVREIVEKNEFSGTLDLEALCEHAAYKGRTVLGLAAGSGHRKIVMLLLSRGARATACDNLGMTPLMHASYGGHVEVVDELLFGGGLDIDQASFSGYTALLFASSAGHAACVQRLIAAGASTALRTPNGRTALIAASLNGHKAAVEILLLTLKPSEVNAIDFEGYSALDAAISRGFAGVESLLRHSPNQ
ncbi:ankyrin repeat protein, putative [Bodo saltans]|uniref:Ankyrin repeat protein, putative n=1 Tax=Bodo saltans TaxID=75058 RepID=A0A0S4KFV3_BODSA|nr:ankyrin repeat protein, putative [Bodo saltans]|eukprot:CUI14481.1 ankyrin repeat protein, putative [Bodo saltans]